MGAKRKPVINPDLCTDVKILIIRKRMNIKDVAAAAKISPSQLGRYFDGYGHLPEKYHRGMCDYLNIDMEAFQLGELKEL